MQTEDLIRAYKKSDFDADAIGEMAATFGDDQAMMVAQRSNDDPQAQQAGLELFQEWKRVCDRHDIEGERDRKALVLRGMSQYIEDAKRKNVALMAHQLTEM